MIKTVKDLEKAIKLCRKLGVQSIKMGDVEFHLGFIPEPQRKKKQIAEVGTSANSFSPGGIADEVNIPVITIPTDELTEEQLLNWSSDSAQ